MGNRNLIIVVLVSAALLGACGSSTAASTSAAAAKTDVSAQRISTQPAAADPFSGAWKSEAPEEATIKALGGGRYSVELYIFMPQCAAGIDGVATLRGNQLVLTESDATAGTCQITMERKGKDLVVEEVESCSSYHGARCTFGDTLQRS